MFRTVDHLSISTPDGLRHLGSRNGMPVKRLWTSEYPLETPLSLAIAFRDWRKQQGGINAATVGPGPTLRTSAPIRAVRKLSQNRLFWPIGGTLSYLGLANSIKVVFERPA